MVLLMVPNPSAYRDSIIIPVVWLINFRSRVLGEYGRPNNDLKRILDLGHAVLPYE